MTNQEASNTEGKGVATAQPLAQAEETARIERAAQVYLESDSYHTRKGFDRLRAKFLTCKKIILTVQKMTCNGVTGFNAYFVKNDGDIEYIGGLGSYWSKAKMYYHVVCWGSSRPLEIYLSIGYALGYTFSECDQRRYEVL